MSFAEKCELFQGHVNSHREIGAYVAKFNLDGKYLCDLENKDILLVGGGQSPVMRGLLEMEIAPNRVVNLDPWAEELPRSKQKLVRENFFEHKMAANTWDEIWALYSLPCYCETLEQARTFYAKSVLGLKPQGNLHAAPVNYSYSSKLDEWKEYERETILTGEPPKTFDHKVLGGVFDDFSAELTDRFPNVYSAVNRRYGHAHIIAPQNKDRLNEWLEKQI